ncbi:MAG: ABC transporter permease [Ilumatobacteraceae bacterium]
MFSSDADASLLRSEITTGLRSEVEAAGGVAETGGLGVVQLGARIPGKGPRDLADTALFGYELAPEGVPDTPPALGQAYADEILKADGVEEGMEILLGPYRTPVTVIGFVSDTNYLGQGSLWASPETWRQVLAENRAVSVLADGSFQALVVRGDGSVSTGALADQIDTATGGATTSLSLADAANSIPGVSEQQGTFNQIIGVTIVVAVVVIALFFALLTVERIGLYGVLKAVGASSATLFGGLLLQALIVTLIASAAASVIAVVLGLAVPAGTIPYAITVQRLVLSTVLLLVAAAIGCIFSLRRVLRIDPATAIGGSR